MSEVHRTDSAHAPEAAPAADRDAKIEQLLLVGLDHYFAARYDHAINVWTRALFFDRSHPRARAYIERARTALAEGQRESEELVQNGIAAFHRGDGDEARRLLQTAIDRGAPSEDAFAVLERLNRIETALPTSSSRRSSRALPAGAPPAAVHASRSVAGLIAWLVVAMTVVAVGGYAAVSSGRLDWRGLLALQRPGSATAAAPVVHDVLLPLPRRAELSIARAKALAATGHLRDALAVLETVRPTDIERADADRLRADIQRQLLALAAPPAPSDPTAEKGDRQVP